MQELFTMKENLMPSKSIIDSTKPDSDEDGLEADN